MTPGGGVEEWRSTGRTRRGMRSQAIHHSAAGWVRGIPLLRLSMLQVAYRRGVRGMLGLKLPLLEMPTRQGRTEVDHHILHRPGGGREYTSLSVILRRHDMKVIRGIWSLRRHCHQLPLLSRDPDRPRNGTCSSTMMVMIWTLERSAQEMIDCGVPRSSKLSGRRNNILYL